VETPGRSRRGGLKPALLLDLDDTLVVERAADAATYAATARFAAVVHDLDPAALVAAVRARAGELYAAFDEHDYCRRIGISYSECLWWRDGEPAELRDRLPEFKRQTWRRALVDVGVDDETLAEGLSELFGRERRRRHANVPGVEDVLAELRETHVLGLVTNGASSIQREKLDASRLEPYFDAVVVSGELGTGKPDQTIFHHALEQLAHDGSQAVMVGDSLPRDVEGALAAGLRAVWIGDGDGRPPDGVPVIASVAQLPITLRG
jgi:putative hydrolase of the HAD superfamily